MVVKYFDIAVQAIFKNWTALQLLITNVRLVFMFFSFFTDNYQEDEEAEEDLRKFELIINALFRKLEDGKQKLRQNGLNSH